MEWKNMPLRPHVLRKIQQKNKNDNMIIISLNNGMERRKNETVLDWIILNIGSIFVGTERDGLERGRENIILLYYISLWRMNRWRMTRWWHWPQPFIQLATVGRRFTRVIDHIAIQPYHCLNSFICPNWSDHLDGRGLRKIYCGRVPCAITTQTKKQCIIIIFVYRHFRLPIRYNNASIDLLKR